MKIFMQMSWRNIWRHKRRSLVVISTVAMGIFAMLVCVGFMNGFNVQLVENTINTSLGHVAIHRKGFQKDMKLEYNFKADSTLYDAIRNNAQVESFAPRVKVSGMIRSSEASRGVTVMGIDPESEKRVSRIYQYTLREGGSSFLDDPSEDAILISKTLAKKLDLVLGDKLVVMIQARDGQIIGAGLRVKGFFVTPIDSIDKHVVYVGISKLQEITRLGGSISEINIITKDKNIADSTKRSMMRAIGNDDFEILSWKDMAPNIVRMIDLADNVVLFFMVIIFMTVIFSIINTMIMAIMERFHEIGVMKSIGTRPSRIFAMIVFEAVNLSAIGLCIGMLLGGLLIALLTYSGLDLSAYSGNLRSWGTGSIIYPSLRTADIMNAALVVMTTTLAAALYPAILAARIKPLEALHFI